MVRANELVEPQIVSHWPVAEHEVRLLLSLLLVTVPLLEFLPLL